MNSSKKGFNGQPQARDRRSRVISYLENQLKANTHTTKEGSVIELTPKDIDRIKSELITLKNRI